MSAEDEQEQMVSERPSTSRNKRGYEVVSERPSMSRDRYKRIRHEVEESDLSNDEDEDLANDGYDDLANDENDDDRPRLVLTIRRSMLAKPPKKTARRPAGTAKCQECGEGVSEIDKKSRNFLVDCADHKAHKYCQAECIENH